MLVTLTDFSTFYFEPRRVIWNSPWENVKLNQHREGTAPAQTAICLAEGPKSQSCAWHAARDAGCCDSNQGRIRAGPLGRAGAEYKLSTSSPPPSNYELILLEGLAVCARAQCPPWSPISCSLFWRVFFPSLSLKWITVSGSSPLPLPHPPVFSLVFCSLLSFSLPSTLSFSCLPHPLPHFFFLHFLPKCRFLSHFFCVNSMCERVCVDGCVFMWLWLCTCVVHVCVWVDVAFFFLNLKISFTAAILTRK